MPSSKRSSRRGRALRNKDACLTAMPLEIKYLIIDELIAMRPKAPYFYDFWILHLPYFQEGRQIARAPMRLSLINKEFHGLVSKRFFELTQWDLNWASLHKRPYFTRRHQLIRDGEPDRWQLSKALQHKVQHVRVHVSRLERLNTIGQSIKSAGFVIDQSFSIDEALAWLRAENNFSLKDRRHLCAVWNRSSDADKLFDCCSFPNARYLTIVACPGEVPGRSEEGASERAKWDWLDGYGLSYPSDTECKALANMLAYAFFPNLHTVRVVRKAISTHPYYGNLTSLYSKSAILAVPDEPYPLSYMKYHDKELNRFDRKFETIIHDTIKAREQARAETRAAKERQRKEAKKNLQILMRQWESKTIIDIAARPPEDTFDMTDLKDALCPSPDGDSSGTLDARASDVTTSTNSSEAPAAIKVGKDRDDAFEMRSLSQALSEIDNDTVAEELRECSAPWVQELPVRQRPM